MSWIRNTGSDQQNTLMFYKKAQTTTVFGFKILSYPDRFTPATAASDPNLCWSF